MNNRRYEKLPIWVGWFGNMMTLQNFLACKTWTSYWALPKMLVSLFNGVGVVIFDLNPISGLLIQVALFLGNINIGFGSLLGGAISIAFAKILRRDDYMIRMGYTVYNGVLIGSVSMALVPALTNMESGICLWTVNLIAIICMTYIDYGMNNIFSSCKLPVLSLPFNIVATIFYVGLSLREPNYLHQSAVADLSPNSTLVTPEVDWSKVFEGVVLSTGQVFCIEDVDSSILIWLATIFFSPILALFFFLGSIIGCVIGVFFNPLNIMAVYRGVWGYNAMLASAAVIYFIKPHATVILTAVVASVLAVAVQAALTPILLQIGLPVMSYPFNIATLLVLATGTTPESRVLLEQDLQSISFPELHVYEYYFSRNKMDTASKEPESVTRLSAKCRS